MNAYVLFGPLRAQTGKGTTLKTILMESAARMHEVDGCQAYLIHADPADDDMVWVYEAWDSPEDHQNSLQVDFIQAAIGKAMPILDGRPEGGQTLELLGGVGLS